MREEFTKSKKALELTAPVKLQEHHDASEFNSGERAIDDYIKYEALDAQRNRDAVVYVTCFEGTDKIAGFFTLSTGSVNRRALPNAKMRRNTPDPVPATLLGRMGVTKELQRQGVGTDLLSEALEGAIRAADQVASRVLIVHLLRDELADWYGKHGFILCPELERTMVMTLPKG